MQQFHKHSIHILISLALFIIALAIISRWNNVDWLAWVSTYDTIVMETVVVETPIPNSTYDNPNTNPYSDTPTPIDWAEENNEIEQQDAQPVTSENEEPSIGSSPVEIARRERKVICHEAYQEKKNIVIRHDSIVERCATMMTIQYAFEAWHGTSRLCREQRNCFWIKENKRPRCIHWPWAFCTYSAYTEWMRDYAELFMIAYEWYPDLKSLLNKYDPTHAWEYYRFVKNNYWPILEYFTGKE